MTGRYVVTELGQTFVGVFDEADEIIAAVEVPDTSPEILPDVAEDVFSDWLMHGARANIGAWLNRERNEGRATVIVAHFEVSV